MFATLTSKGQITVPKEIRDKLGLDAGSMLDFQLRDDNTITVRAVKPNALSIVGILKSPYARTLTVEQMDKNIAKHLKEKERIRRRSRNAAAR